MSLQNGSNFDLTNSAVVPLYKINGDPLAKLNRCMRLVHELASFPGPDQLSVSLHVWGEPRNEAMHESLLILLSFTCVTIYVSNLNCSTQCIYYVLAK